MNPKEISILTCCVTLLYNSFMVPVAKICPACLFEIESDSAPFDGYDVHAVACCLTIWAKLTADEQAGRLRQARAIQTGPWTTIPWRDGDYLARHRECQSFRRVKVRRVGKKLYVISGTKEAPVDQYGAFEFLPVAA